MISHLTLGTNNLEKAEFFYSQILKPIEASLIYKSESVVFYQFPDSSTKLSITKPYDGQPATVGNGTMLALKLRSVECVQKTHQLAMALGGTCEGEPGPRNENAYFGAYFRDLDGNKVAIFYRPEE